MAPEGTPSSGLSFISFNATSWPLILLTPLNTWPNAPSPSCSSFWYVSRRPYGDIAYKYVVKLIVTTSEMNEGRKEGRKGGKDGSMNEWWKNNTNEVFRYYIGLLLGTFDIISLISNTSRIYFRCLNYYTVVFISEIAIQNMRYLEVI